MQHGDEVNPILWLKRAKEFFDAIDKLSIENTSNRFCAPSVVLLAFAYEQLFKSHAKMMGQKPEYTHDLKGLWCKSKDELSLIVNSATAEFIKENYSELGDRLAVFIELDPNYGKPKYDFETSLQVLNEWTRKGSFQARYPKVGVMFGGEVDVKYLRFVGQKIQIQLSENAYRYSIKKKAI